MTDAICLEEERACPPEDAGSPSGYMDYIYTMRDHFNQGHQQMTDGKIGSARNLPPNGVPDRDVARNLGESVTTRYRWVPAFAHPYRSLRSVFRDDADRITKEVP